MAIQKDILLPSCTSLMWKCANGCDKGLDLPSMMNTDNSKCAVPDDPDLQAKCNEFKPANWRKIPKKVEDSTK